jgi:hypothetical protein
VAVPTGCVVEASSVNGTRTADVVALSGQCGHGRHERIEHGRRERRTIEITLDAQIQGDGEVRRRA